MEARAKLIDLAAFLDRVDRAEGDDDFRIKAFRNALQGIESRRTRTRQARPSQFERPDRSSQSPPPRPKPLPARGRESRLIERTLLPMRFIEPHAHMVSRTTDDYLAIATAGCQAVCEPAFWAGFDRTFGRWLLRLFSPIDRVRTEARGQIRVGRITAGFASIPRNPKTSNWPAEVIDIIPQFLDRPNVLGIGEIGLNKNSRNELTVFEKHVDLAARHDQLILIHTPHLEDKLKGTRLIIDALKSRQPHQAGAGHHRPRRGAHHRTGAGRRLLGRDDSLPGIQMHGGAGGGHGRTLRQRATVDEQRLRLGRERAAGRAARGVGNAAARPHAEADGRDDLPEPAQFLGQSQKFTPRR